MTVRVTFRCVDCGTERRENRAARRRLYCPECDDMKTFEADPEEHDEVRRRARENRRARSTIVGSGGDSDDD